MRTPNYKSSYLNMCLNPFIKQGTSGAFSGKGHIGVGRQNQPVDCGRCPQCINKMIRDWSIRLEYHTYVTENPLFVTLTYSPQHIPTNGSCSLKTRRAYGKPTLFKKDVQDFLKRLRKSVPQKLSYMVVGEYGTKFDRPHYHLLLFNLPCQFEHLVDVHWFAGITQVKPFRDQGAVKYLMKYVSKKGRLDRSRNPEYRNTSKGLGLNYVTPQMWAYHRQSPEFCKYTYADGRTVPLPRYYKKLIYGADMVDTETGEIIEAGTSYSETTIYLRELAETTRKERIRLYMANHPDLSVKQCIENLEMSRLNVSLPERNPATEFF